MVGVRVVRGLVGVVDGNGEIAVWGRVVVYLQVLESVRGVVVNTCLQSR